MSSATGASVCTLRATRPGSLSWTWTGSPKLVSPLAERDGHRKSDGDALLEELMRVAGFDQENIAKQIASQPTKKGRYRWHANSVSVLPCSSRKWTGMTDFVSRTGHMARRRSARSDGLISDEVYVGALALSSGEQRPGMSELRPSVLEERSDGHFVEHGLSW